MNLYEALADFYKQYDVKAITAQNWAAGHLLNMTLITEECNEALDAGDDLHTYPADSVEHGDALTDYLHELADIAWCCQHYAYGLGHYDLMMAIDDLTTIEGALAPEPVDIVACLRAAQGASKSLLNAGPYAVDGPVLVICLLGHLAALTHHCIVETSRLGFDLFEILEIVGGWNAAKVWDDGEIHRAENGKVLKPPGFVGPKPEIRAVVAAKHTVDQMAV